MNGSDAGKLSQENGRMKMKRCLATMTALALLVLIAAGCGEPVSPTAGPRPTSDEVNFRLLVSDLEVPTIERFASLNVTITSIGVHKVGEAEGWTEEVLEPAQIVDLRPLTGTNATAVWDGYLTPGQYNKVFIHVSVAEGALLDTGEGETITVKLPSGKLQISKPFEVTESGVTNFVYDISVVEAGKSGQYILKPQIGESGPDQDFDEVPVPKARL